jgi:hypothetical protein
MCVWGGVAGGPDLCVQEPSRTCCHAVCVSAHAGTIGYVLLNIVAAAGIVGSTLVFMSLLVFEIYRSIKFARVHDVARQVEEEAVEVPTTTQLGSLFMAHARPTALWAVVDDGRCPALTALPV